MSYAGEELWQVSLEFPAAERKDPGFTYHYILKEPGGTLVHDWGQMRRLHLNQGAATEVRIVDSWNFAGFPENALLTEPFRRVLLKRTENDGATPPSEAAKGGNYTFKVQAPLLAPRQTVCLLGNAAALRNWDAGNPILLTSDPEGNGFTARVQIDDGPVMLEYKYGIYDLESRTFVRYEQGQNRSLHLAGPDFALTLVDDGFIRESGSHWKGAGVAIPVFSLRTEKGFGVGEFEDLKPLADWAARTGLKLIQILPVNDTTATHSWHDSYPYSGISAFALHPIYLNLEKVANSKNKRLLAKLEPDRQRLNALPHLDYERVMEAKLVFIRQIYPSQKDATFKSAGFKAFLKENRHWLEPYAAFCCLRDRFGTADFNTWQTHREYNEKQARALGEPGAPTHDSIWMTYFLQYHLHCQLREAVEYAHSRGVILKGDIPIGVYRYGADVWQQPELYFSNMQAGAPPDAFAEKGQNWSFPTYNWPKMKQTGFAWWKQRFTQMANYFDAFRIDHVLGFFRIWSIPLHAVEGILGYFVPALPVREEEFAARKVAFDRKRFLEPYIMDEVLRDVFSRPSEWTGAPEELCAEAKERFLQPTEKGRYRLRPEFATQRLVEQYFNSREATPRNARLQLGLFDLLSNVLLFEVPGATGPELHFRLGMDISPSFKHLEPFTQKQLRELYLDYFFKRQDDFWRASAMQKLPALKAATNMLILGEDLGMVPDCVPGVMSDLGLLGLEVQRMPKRLGQTFSRPAEAPYLSVVTPGTHDMSVIRGWWEEDPGLTQRFFNEEMGLKGTAPAKCEPWINQLIVAMHLASPAMWSIFQIQDLLGMAPEYCQRNPAEERINVPANVKNYWKYRMHVSFEDLLKADAFNDALRSRIQLAGRA